ncbi:hypothetical protein [Mariprofundus ferrooxydans]|uniref:hypothetical protein n=1 Tax=Mariprofundus ferrooxydans TaxID=314344 RepID=UPI00036F7512|nr:hypothetical protein [Mariprofundus ferrooxydans]
MLKQVDMEAHTRHKSYTLIFLILIAFASTFFWHELYFFFSSSIWERNIQFDKSNITFWLRGWTDQQDGVEIYALYTLLFVSAFTVLASFVIFRGTIHSTNRSLYIILPLCIVALIFVAVVGIKPPLAEASGMHISTSVCVFFASLVYVLFLRSIDYFFGATLMYGAAALSLVPVCFIAFHTISWGNYAYVLSPALRMMHGADLSEIYFQYGVLVSLFAKIWMDMGMEPGLFYIVAQLSLFVLLFSIFVFSKSLFFDKTLPLLLLVSLVLVRIYSGLTDPVALIQTSPLRLDWWLPFLVIVYVKGPYHWSSGLFCSFMILLHGNLGIIYTLAYVELLAVIFFLDCADELPFRKFKFQFLWEKCKGHFNKSRINLIVIFISALVSAFLFNGEYSGSTLLYQKIGFGFLRIQENSFYWYFGVLIALVPTVLFVMRQSLSKRYMTSAVFLVLLVAGNSVYYFGRSHDANIIHISASLIFLFFLFLDLVARYYSEMSGSYSWMNWKKWLHEALAVVFILLVCLSYGSRIKERVAIQIEKAKNFNFVLPVSEQVAYVDDGLAAIRTVTGDSKKVYFLAGDGFQYYYRGQYVPRGYFNPYTAWVFKDEELEFLQHLIHEGYYIVLDNDDDLKEEHESLDYSNEKIVSRFLIVWDDSAVVD